MTTAQAWSSFSQASGKRSPVISSSRRSLPQKNARRPGHFPAGMQIAEKEIGNGRRLILNISISLFGASIIKRREFRWFIGYSAAENGGRGLSWREIETERRTRGESSSCMLSGLKERPLFEGKNRIYSTPVDFHWNLLYTGRSFFLFPIYEPWKFGITL